MSPKDTALFWLDSGIATIPLLYKSKVPLVKWGDYKTRLPSLSEIDMWYDDGRLKNLALVSGWSGLLVLDFDTLESWATWMVWQLEYNPAILDTYRVSSSRGVHCYYYLSEPVKLDSIQNALFEIKTGGKLVTTPPSVHESGKQYSSKDDPSNIKVVTPEQILNYSPLHFAPVVYPLSRSKYAPTISSGNDLLPEILKIPILQFFDNAMPVDADKRFYRTHCPFHGHRSNFWIDTQLNICGCYKGCIGKPSLDVVAFYSQLNDISNSDAIKELKRLL